MLGRTSGHFHYIALSGRIEVLLSGVLVVVIPLLLRFLWQLGAVLFAELSISRSSFKEHFHLVAEHCFSYDPLHFLFYIYFLIFWRR